MEDVDGVPKSIADNLSKIQTVLEKNGIQLIPENGGGAGIRFRNRADGTRDEH